MNYWQRHFCWGIGILISYSSIASTTLSYSGRLVNTNGSPVTGTPTLIFDLAYTGSTSTIRCTDTISNVPLTNGVFHVKIDFDCTAAGASLENVLALVPVSESVTIRVTNSTASKVYSFQDFHAVPKASVAETSKQLVQMGANTDEVLTWDGAKWIPKAISGATGGTVTSIATGSGLSGGPITTSGTIAIANSGVTDTHLAGNIARSKLANGTANAVLINDVSGVMSEVAQLPVSSGGTGSDTAAGARTNLGLGTAATAALGYASGNALPADNIPVCLPAFKLRFTGIGPLYWECASDNDSLDSTKLPLSGGTMAGAIDMGTNKIINLGTPTLDADAATKLYVDNKVGAVAGSQWTTSGSDIYYTTGNVGIGLSTVLPDAKLQLESYTDDASFRGVNVDLRSHSTVDGNYSNLAGVFKAQSTIASGVTNSGALTGTWDVAFRNNRAGFMDSGTLALLRGTNIQYGHYNSEAAATPITTDAYGVYVSPYYRTGSISNMYDFYAHPGTAGGTVTNHYGFYIAGNQKKNYIEGNIGIGIAVPTEKLHVVGNAAIDGRLKLKSNNANYVELKAPDALAGTLLFNLPGTAGTSGQALVTDGSGNLSWATVSAGGTAVGGDLTGTVSSATIASGAVDSGKIANGTIVDADVSGTAAIAQSKIANLTTDLDNKQNTIPLGTSAQYYRGDKSWQTLDTSVVPENGNLYFTQPRVLGSLLSGLSTLVSTPIADTDSVLTAFGKLQGQFNLKEATYGNWTKTGSDIYYNTGNVGVGNTSPQAKVHATIAETGYGFMLTDSAAPAGHLLLAEGGSTANTFGPHIGGRPSGASRMMSIYSDIVSGEDTGTIPTMVIAGRHNSGAVTTRPILDIRNNATSLMHFQAGGNVGVGTTSPSEKFEVVGGNIKTDGEVLSDSVYTADASISTFAIGDYMEVVEAHPNVAGTSATWEVHVAATRNTWTEGHTYLVATTHNQTNEWREATQISENMYSASAQTKCFTLDVNGNTSSPRFRIRAINTIANCGIGGNMSLYFKIRSIGSNAWWQSLGGVGNTAAPTKFQPTGNSFHVLTGHPGLGTSVPSTLTVASNGNVGIGTKTPTARLTVANPTSSTSIKIARPAGNFGLIQFSTDDSRRWELGVSNGAESGSDVGSDLGLWSYGDGGAQGQPIFVKRSTGFVGLGGTTNPYAQLHVVGNIAATGWVGAGCEAGCSTDAYAINYADGRIATYDGSSAVCTKTGGSATFTCSSDRRLKDDIHEFNDGLDKIIALQPKTYVWKRDDTKTLNYGFIAQEVQKVIPHAISKQQRPEGEFLSLDQGAFTPYMINAIKDLNAKIEKKSVADRKIASLEEENKKIKEENKEMKDFLCKKFKDADFCEK